MTRPYYEDADVRLYLGDCRDVPEWLEADVLITDPPYGQGGELSKNQYKVHEVQTWDNDLAVRDAALELWGDRPRAVFGTPLRMDAAPSFREFPLIWEKSDAPGMGDTSFPWGRGYEMIYVDGQGWQGRRSSPILRILQHTHEAREAEHPTPKPIALMQTLIRKAPPGVIADPFSGTAATLIAARSLGRQAIGVELDERYAERAARRLAANGAVGMDIFGDAS